MKKYIITIIIILASITSIYAFTDFFSSNISIDKVSQINLYYKGQLKESYTPKKDTESDYDLEYLSLLDSLNHMKESDFDIPSDTNYRIDIISNNQIDSYKFDVKLETLGIYVSYEDKNYIIESDYAKDLFISRFFDEIYYDKILYNSEFSLNELSLKPSVSSDISYFTPYDTQSNKKISYASGNPILDIHDYENQNTISFAFAEEPSNILIQTYKKDILIDEQSSNTGDFKLLKREGLTTYKVITSWEKTATNHFSGLITYTFDVEMDIDPEFELISNNKGAGEFFIVKALYFNDDEKPLVKSDSIKNKYFEKVGDDYILIIPLNYYQKEASYDIDLYLIKNEIESLIDSKKLIIENRKFTSQNLTIDKSTVAATSTDNAYTEFAKYFTPSREKSNPKAYFTESFMLPIDGRISTQFGMMRYVNGSLTSYRHSGIDIAVPRGTPVPATNTGKVVLARELILTGNTVVIDHGLGIFSVYYHMDTLNVSDDDMVEKAHIIGSVGSTGRSTGPHLHFTTSFYKTNINPNFLFDLSETELKNLID